VPVLSVGEVGLEKRNGTCADFLMPALSGASTVRSRTYGFGLNPETWGRDSIFPGKYDRPGNFSIFRENYQSPLQGFQYTNHIEKLAEGRIVAVTIEKANL